MNKAELILKVILASQATIVDTYKALIVEGSETDFQRVLELKVKWELLNCTERHAGITKSRTKGANGTIL
jgi:hypothetical protein